MLSDIQGRGGIAPTMPFLFGAPDTGPPPSLGQILLDIGQPMKVAAHRAIAHSRDDNILLLVSGEVSLRVCSQTGNELVLKTCRAGDILLAQLMTAGEAFYIRHVCETGCSFRIASRAECQLRAGATESLDQEINAASHRLQLDYFRVMHEIAFMPTAQRLYSEILRLDAGARQTGGDIFTLPTHQALANQLATSRETISREIGFLRRQRVIDLDGRRVRLLDRGFLIRKIRVALDLAHEDDVLRSIGLS